MNFQECAHAPHRLGDDFRFAPLQDEFGVRREFRDVFGEKTVSSRLVIGAASLPLGSPVELEVILEVHP